MFYNFDGPSFACLSFSVNPTRGIAEFTYPINKKTTVAEIADRTAYDVRYS